MKKIVLFIFTTALLLIVSGPTHAYIGDAYYKPGWDIVKWDNSWRWDNELPFENPFYNRDLIYYNYDTEEQRLVLKANQEVVLKNAIHTESQGKTLRSSKNSRCWINLKQERNWLQKPGSSDKLSPYDPHGTPLIIPAGTKFKLRTFVPTTVVTRKNRPRYNNQIPTIVFEAPDMVLSVYCSPTLPEDLQDFFSFDGSFGGKPITNSPLFPVGSVVKIKEDIAFNNLKQSSTSFEYDLSPKFAGIDTHCSVDALGYKSGTSDFSLPVHGYINQRSIVRPNPAIGSAADDYIWTSMSKVFSKGTEFDVFLHTSEDPALTRDTLQHNSWTLIERNGEKRMLAVSCWIYAAASEKDWPTFNGGQNIALRFLDPVCEEDGSGRCNPAWIPVVDDYRKGKNP